MVEPELLIMGHIDQNGEDGSRRIIAKKMGFGSSFSRNILTKLEFDTKRHSKKPFVSAGLTARGRASIEINSF